LSEGTLRVESSYAGFDEFWPGFLSGVGPAGVYCASLDDEGRQRLRREVHDRLDQPSGAFTLEAVARYARGRSAG
jgi:hypothetical protein